MSCCCWCVGREVEPTPADLESRDAVEARRRWPNDRLAHPWLALNSRESGEPHSRSLFSVGVNGLPDILALGARRLLGGLGVEDPPHLRTLLTEEDVEAAYRSLNAHRRNGVMLIDLNAQFNSGVSTLTLTRCALTLILS